MDRYLEQSREALEVEELAGRWHHMRGLYSRKVKDGLSAVQHITTALRLDRKRMLQAEAGRLWNDLALSRAHVDDLAWRGAGGRSRRTTSPGLRRPQPHNARTLQPGGVARTARA